MKVRRKTLAILVDEEDSDLLQQAWHFATTTLCHQKREKDVVLRSSLKRIIMERKLQRKLLSSEYVYYRDKNRLNNTRANLYIYGAK